MSLMDRFKGKIAGVNGPDINTIRGEADRLRDAGKFGEAAEAYARYLADNPDDFGIWVQRGNCLKDSDSYAAAKMAYERAVELNPTDDDVYLQIGHLMKKQNKNKEAAFYYKEALKANELNQNATNELRSLGFKTKNGASPLQDGVFLASLANFIDISDLLIFLSVHSRVTGIQRVQSCIVAEIIALHHRLGNFSAGNTVFCYCDQETQTFYAVSVNNIIDLLESVELSVESRVLIDDAIRAIYSAKVEIKPRKDDVYIILGAFWIGHDYTSSLLSLKRSGVKFGVYIYDLIPITHPQFVTESTRQAVIDKFADVMLLADFALTISEFVAVEVRHVMSAELDRQIPVIAVPLAHALPESASLADGEELDEEFIANLPPEFVLCVCTLEGRKNHLILLQTWLSLNRKYGSRTPTLILVGKWGWKIEEFSAQLSASRNADGKIIILGNLSDKELDYLYRNCLFTVFPSFVEGWGLPVGESLAYGKPCIASNTSSIPEVGGDFCRYFSPYDPVGALTAIEETLLDREALRAWTERVAKEFEPRTWRDVAVNFLEKMDSAVLQMPKHSIRATILQPGKIVQIRSSEIGGVSGAWRGRAVRFICAANWRQPESWGSWSSKRTAILSFGTTLNPGTVARVLMQLRLPPPQQRDNLVIRISNQAVTVFFDNGNPKWIAAEGLVDETGVLTIELERLGRIEQLDPNRPIFHGISAICYHEKNDIAARLDLLESIVVFGN